jgi:hypothetical protein
MPKLAKTIRYDLADCAEELQKLISHIDDRTLEESEFQIGMQHAFHHLNFAWNARHWPLKRYRMCTQRDFNQAGRFPRDLYKD